MSFRNKKAGIMALIPALSIMLSGCSEGGNSSVEETDKTTIDTTSAIESTISDEDIQESLDNGIIIDEVSKELYKTDYNANPISASIFCADPTAVEYEGRLYVYGTNDHQQYEQDTKNDYDQIKSLVVFSTDDMVNWVYHGRIETGVIAPWIINSWAPSIASRVEEDGKTHFYLYFSNNGTGVGVITATNPLGPWSDPLGKPFITAGMEGLENCPSPFDPGVCIDENGVGWLSFGGGSPADGGIVHTNIPKVAKLGEDMLSFDSEFVSIDAPYFFEASELNYIDGTYYYTYCTDWQARDGWDIEGKPKPPQCSMAYMTTKTPLEADSWEYRGAYFYNAGENAEGQSGMKWANNHTHFMEYEGTNYIFHHTQLLDEAMDLGGGFRSLMVEYLPMDKATGEIPITAASRKGVKQIKLLDPYKENSGATSFTSAGIGYTEPIAEGVVAAKSNSAGSYIYVRGVDFQYGIKSFTANVKGKGRIEIRLDDVNSDAVAFVEFDNQDYENVISQSVNDFEGRNHNVYIVFSGEEISLLNWKFEKGDTERPEEAIDNTDVKYEPLIITGQAENPGPSPTTTIDMTGNKDYSVQSSSFDKESDVINLGFINQDKDATFKVLVKSLGLETDEGIVEIPVNVTLDPTSGSDNGLANGWGGAEIGTIVYGDEKTGLVAAETEIDWVGYRFALIIEGEEVPYTSITYNISVTGLILE